MATGFKGYERHDMRDFLNNPPIPDVGGWQGCDSKSNLMCLGRKCTYAKFLYFIDQGSPEIECNRPEGKAWEPTKVSVAIGF